MGLAISKLYKLLTFEKDTRILLLGLDAAGKTTALYKMKLGEVVTTIPTIGFNVEQVKYKNLNMAIWDVGGQDKIRALWRHYYENTDALLWIVDSNDEARLAEARDELHKTLSDDLLRDAICLVLANKQDMPNAMAPDKVAERLGLHSLGRRKWYIQPCSAATGEGLFEGLEWLNCSLRERSVTAHAG